MAFAYANINMKSIVVLAELSILILKPSHSSTPFFQPPTLGSLAMRIAAFSLA